MLITKLQGAVQPPQQQHSMRIPRYRRGHFPESTAETVDAVARPSQVIALNRRRRNEMPRVRLCVFRWITVALIHARSAPHVTSPGIVAAPTTPVHLAQDSAESPRVTSCQPYR